MKNSFRGPSNCAPEQHYLILTADFPPIEGGISTVTTQLAAGLARRNRLHSLGAPRVQSEPPASLSHDDAALPYQVFRIPGYSWGMLRALPARRPVRRWIEQHPGQITKIIAMNAGFGGWLARRFQRRFGLPYDTFAYGFEFLKFRRNPPARSFLVNIYKAADRVLSISDYTTGELLRFGVPPERITRIRLGVDTKRFRPDVDGTPLRHRWNAGEKTVLLSVGRLIPRKGHRLVIQAMREILPRHPDLVYWIAGRGPERDPLESLVRRLGLESHVQFLGYLPEDELPQLYAASDLFILPTQQVGESVEGYGLVFLEAAACGKPSVAGRTGGVPEAVRDGETGVLIDSFDSVCLAGALIDLLNRPERIRSLGQAALRRAEQFSVERMLDSF